MNDVAPYIGQAIIIVFMGYLTKVTGDIRSEMKIANGRLAKAEARLDGEVKLSDERQGANVKRLDKLEH